MDKVDFVQKTQMIVDSGLESQTNPRRIPGFPVSRVLGPESFRFVKFVGLPLPASVH